ncbi:MAG TPA: helix-turn-helix domain-containing protein, partial [Armatimonadota bacterium]|nr:helix-turn-helix domain-containing protein [Armatimonadota bacterium]
ASCEVPDKLLALLKQLAERHGVPTNEGMEIGVRLTQNELAALIGSCREAVSRGLKSLRERGLIRVRAHTITLLASA